MESQGAANPGILILTTSLSKPFLRLDKYVTLLQELERHVEVCGMQDHQAGHALGCQGIRKADPIGCFKMLWLFPVPELISR